MSSHNWILRLSLVLLAAVPLLPSTPGLFAKTRSEIPDKYKWDLTEIYKDSKAFDADLKRLQDYMDQFVALKGTLNKGPEQVLKAFQISDELGMIFSKAYRYASLSFDLDQRNNDLNAQLQQVRIMAAKFGTATAWFNPELLTIPEKTMKEWLAKNKDLSLYTFDVMDLYRQQEHVLNEEQETLLSYFSPTAATPGDCYSSLSTADIKFPTITLSTGKEETLSPANYSLLLRTARNRADRQEIFKSHYATYGANINTYASLYNGVLQDDWAQAQARKYPTTLDAALNGNKIPASVVNNLISTVKSGTAPIQRYMKLRKKALGLDAIDLYDTRQPLVDFDRTYEYDDAAKDVIAAVKPLGKDYQDRIRKAFDSRWVDVYESEGKAAGGYSSGVYGVHPFIKMNYNGTIDEVFTLAHEMGHSLHSVYSQETQPYVHSQYTIFVAEVASTMNEALLLDYLLDNSKSRDERIMLLQRALDNILGTFYSQVMFADFELQAHQLVEKGQPITSDELNQIYYDLLKTYYGDSLELNELYQITWARISHFFEVPYYVYQYATSFAASAKLAKEVLGSDKKQSDQALDRFTTLLKSGGNDYPIEQLKKAGVDMTQPDVVQAVVERTNDLVTRLEKELASK